MKRNKFNNIIFATLIASAFVACNDDDELSSFGTPYNANTGSIANSGAAVDLGLPSGTLWADKNVGAASAEDMGVSFIWGDITGTQVSANESTYKVGTGIDLKSIFENQKGDYKASKEKVQIAKEDVIVQSEDSTRNIYSYHIIIDRLANVKVKDANGNFVVDKDGEFVREPKTYRDVDDVIFMAYDSESAKTALDNYLAPYKNDSYNKYHIVEVKEILTHDVIQHLVPIAGQIDTTTFIKNLEKNSGKKHVGSYFANARFNEVDQYFHVDFIVEALDESYFEGRDGEVPSLTIVGNVNYDAATKNWGNGWAMPTTAQLQELINECQWEFTVNGYKVTGKNGKSIFLPAAGYRYGSTLIGNGVSGYYASGEVSGKYTFPSAEAQNAGSFGTIENLTMANIMTFNYGQFDNSKRILNTFAEKSIGVSIRPVAVSK